MKEMKRNNLDIMADILRTASRGSRKTRIIYSTNLNFNIGGRYLTQLIKHGLMAVHRGSIIYKTTEKGHEFLDKYDDLMEYRNLVVSSSRTP